METLALGQVLATSEDDHCLGKRNCDRVSKNKVGTKGTISVKDR